MSEKQHGNKKQARLFVCVEGVTDDTFTLCGGPDIDDAMAGLVGLIREAVAHAMKHAEDGEKVPAIQLMIDRMTDKEVDQLDQL